MSWEGTISVVTGAVGAIGGTIFGYRGLQRARHVDKVTELTGAAAITQAGINQAWEQLQDMNSILQIDNQALRTDAKESKLDTRELKEAIAKCTIRVAEILKERDDARLEVARLIKKYGEDT